MKKTLIALAALGVVGAARAQVTISGEISAGVTKGIGGSAEVAVHDSDINFAVKEDLGGGLSVAGLIGYEGGSRKSAVTVNKTNVTVAGGFGSIALDTGIAGATRLSSNVNTKSDLTTALTDGAGYTNITSLTYSLPVSLGPVGVKVNWYKTDATSGPAIPMKAWDDASNSRIILSYADGPMTASFEHRKNGKRNRYAAGYDFGAASVQVAGGSDKQSAFLLRVPMGAVTIDLHTENLDNATYAAAGKKVTGTGVAVVYALSKATSVNWSTVTIKDAKTAATNGTNYRVELSHKF
jgi:hypothetical protein